MCCRYYLTYSEELLKRYDISKNEYQKLPKKFLVYPGSRAPVVAKNSKGNHLKLIKWGMIPSWAKDPKIGSKMINARAETLDKKPSWKKPFASQRILVPASGYYEWKKTDKKSQQYVIKHNKEKYFSLAGLYDVWKDQNNKIVPSFTIVTRPSGKKVGQIHDRMPVILKSKDEKKWINNKNKDIDSLEEILKGSGDKDLVVSAVKK